MPMPSWSSASPEWSTRLIAKGRNRMFLPFFTQPGPKKKSNCSARSRTLKLQSWSAGAWRWYGNSATRGTFALSLNRAKFDGGRLRRNGFWAPSQMRKLLDCWDAHLEPYRRAARKERFLQQIQSDDRGEARRKSSWAPARTRRSLIYSSVI